jgi:hypothetical protein
MPRSTFTALVAIGLALSLTVAHAEPVGRTINVREFRPTQMEVGRAAIDYHVEKWKKEAAAHSMSFTDFARDVLRPRFAAQRIGAVIDPEGNLRNTDAHHRISALRKVTALTGVELEIGANILADYRGQSHAQYADHFLNTLKKGQFTVEAERLSPEQRMKKLPATYAELGNNALRSSLEIVFSRRGIDGGTMRDYVEFRIARRLLADGLLDELKASHVVPQNARKVPVRLATDPRVLAAVERRLPGLEAYLMSEANDAAAGATIAARLDAMKNR